MTTKVIITISVVVAIGGIGVWYVVSSIVEPIIAPHVELTQQQFTPGPCQQDWFLFWVIGHHQMVTARFNLTNDGFSDGRARVIFTAEGAQVASEEFFIGAGKTEVKEYQFRMNDCGEHSFSAHLGGVERS
jgi:hypothetical protein